MKPVQIKLPEVHLPASATVQETTYARLYTALMVGNIEPGMPVTIRGLAQVMGTSPTPVREALRRLSSQNALQVLENRRIVVPEMTSARFRELVKLRAALETHAAHRALAFISLNLVEEIADIDRQMDEAIERQDRIQLILLNQKFHRLIYCANPEQLAMPMIESIWLQLGPFMRVALRHLEQFYPIDRHKEIIAALRKVDSKALVRAINADITDSVGKLDAKALAVILNQDQSKHRPARRVTTPV